MLTTCKNITLNERGYRIGEAHHRAKFTDQEIESILFLREQGLSYAAIAAKFDDGKTISKSAVRDVCKGTVRGQPVMRTRRAG